jgi:hypothetical protein
VTIFFEFNEKEAKKDFISLQGKEEICVKEFKTLLKQKFQSVFPSKHFSILKNEKLQKDDMMI